MLEAGPGVIELGRWKSEHIVGGVHRSGPAMSGAAATLPGGKGLVESLYEMLWTKNNLLQVVLQAKCARVAVARACVCSRLRAYPDPNLWLTCGRTCVLAAADALHVPQVSAGPYSRHGAARQ